jgi:hypothetical protein
MWEAPPKAGLHRAADILPDTSMVSAKSATLATIRAATSASVTGIKPLVQVVSPCDVIRHGLLLIRVSIPHSAEPLATFLAKRNP